MFRVRLATALVVATLPIAGLSAHAGSPAPAVGHVPAVVPDGAVRLRLTTLSGVSAAGVEARVMVTDGLVQNRTTTAVVHKATTDLDGFVDIDFPDADPYVLSRPAQDHFNVEVQFVARPLPGYVSTAMLDFVYDRREQREATVVPVSGKVFMLSAPRREPPPYREEVDCKSDWNEPDDSIAAWVCVKWRRPLTMHAIPTVLATNVGAGHDVTLKMTYEEAGRIQTTRAHDAGVGPVEVGGSTAVKNDDSTTLVFGGGNQRYGSPNEYAIVQTAWVAIDRYYCEHPQAPFTGPPNCRPDGSSWFPEKVTGGRQEDRRSTNPLWHDRWCGPPSPADCPNGHKMTCIVDMPMEYEIGFGTENERVYRAGIDLNGSVKGIDLHASAEYTRNRAKAKTSAYKYTALNPSTLHHYLFTYTDLPYDETVGHPPCPENDIGNSWTTTEKPVVSPDPVAAAQDVADEVDKQVENNTGSNPGTGNTTQQAGRCRYVPEDCKPQAAGSAALR